MDDNLLSRDGTRIAYERAGRGHSVILVSGALSTGGTLAPLAAALAERFETVVYDRRGRGDSGDTAPYDVLREVEDLAALVETVGGEASLFGVSSGGALVLRALAEGLPVRRAVVYEVPYADFSPAGAEERAAYTRDLTEALEQGRRGDAVELFLRLTGMADDMIRGARQAPMWAALESVAPSLAHDDAVMGGGLVPRELLAPVGVPVLALAGGASPDWMQRAAHAVAEALPQGSSRILEGQTHVVDPDAVAPVLTEFLAA
ncbi:alpha/beta hydrolase [Streptomyces longwoodensis]|uniref:alpha/beta fold hydrolase n=1 Tax=Streptomyces longwoodensis TaxID=68231 RepID=UPI002DDC0C24|nr:alpha/beta hydrolase [Streptomyces longwoodensis]WRY90784.1 alpha/beta hydrolase [Streptomyces longwoodensis]WTI44923.1 alpha/beta hydrolase [Streptomyces longwoodensis]WUC57721.1 alpha/beta hydrolase [Streptomyces longwoodensis]